MAQHTARAESSLFYRHFVDGQQVAVVAVADWDSYVRTVWALEPAVVALQPSQVANFPGDASSGTPAALPAKEGEDIAVNFSGI